MLWPLVVLAAAVCAAADIEVLFFQNTLQRADWKEGFGDFFVSFLNQNGSVADKVHRLNVTYCQDSFRQCLDAHDFDVVVVGSESSEQIKLLAEEKEIPNLHGSGANPLTWTSQTPYAFGLQLPSTLYTQQVIRQAAARHLTTAVMIRDGDSEFQRLSAVSASEWIRESGLKLICPSVSWCTQWMALTRCALVTVGGVTRCRCGAPEEAESLGYKYDSESPGFYEVAETTSHGDHGLVAFVEGVIEDVRAQGEDPQLVLNLLSSAESGLLAMKSKSFKYQMYYGQSVLADGSNLTFNDAIYNFGSGQWHEALRFADPIFASTEAMVTRYLAQFGHVPSDDSAACIAAGVSLTYSLQKYGRSLVGLSPSERRVEIRRSLGQLNDETFFGRIRFDRNNQNVGRLPISWQLTEDGAQRLVLPPEFTVEELRFPSPSWQVKAGCPSGFGSSFGSPLPTECNACQEGTFRSTSTPPLQFSECEPCPLGRGTLPGERGSVDCPLCPAGRYQNGSSFGICSPCPTGTFANISGSVDCQPCDVDSYADEPGLDSCKPCPESSSQPQVGQASCICDVGSYRQAGLDGLACLPCDPVLPGGTTVHRNSRGPEDCVCPSGTHWYRPSSRSPLAYCRSCARGLLCPGGFDKGQHQAPLQARGYAAGLPAYPGAGPAYIISCSNNWQCPGELPLGECQPNSYGTACNKCNAGYYERDGRCQSCSEPLDVVPMLVALAFLLVAAGGFYVFATRMDRSHRDSLFMIIAAAGLTFLSVNALPIFSKIDVQLVEPLRSLRLILLVLSLDFDLLRPDCWMGGGEHPVSSYFGAIALYPCGSIALLCLFAIAKFVFKKDVTWYEVKYVHGVLTLALYVLMTSLTMRPLRCVLNPDGSFSLGYHRDVMCWRDDTHFLMLAMSFLPFFGVVVNFVVTIGTMVFRYPRKLGRQGGAKYVKQWSFIFGHFVPKCYYFALIFTLRNFVLGILPAIFISHKSLLILSLAFTMCSYGFIQVTLWPWKTFSANVIDAGFALLTVMVMILATTLLEFDVEQELLLIQILSMLLAALVFFGAVAALVISVYKTYKPSRTYGIFLSHHKLGAGALARWFKMMMAEIIKNRIFLDSDDVNKLDAIMDVTAHDAENVVVLITSETLHRMWCAAEIACAWHAGTNIVLVSCDGNRVDEDLLAVIECLWNEEQEATLLGAGVTIEMIESSYCALRDHEHIELDRRGAAERLHQRVVQQVIENSRGLTRRQFASRLTISGRRRSADGLAPFMMLSDLRTPEVGSCARVIMYLLRNRLQEDICLYDPYDVVNDLHNFKQEMAVAVAILVLLTQGMLQDVCFAGTMAACPFMCRDFLVPIRADEFFVYPDPGFWENLAEGKVFEGQTLAEMETDFDGVRAAYAKLFNVLALKFSQHGSEYIQNTEIAMIGARLQPMLSGSGPGAVERYSSSASSRRSSRRSHPARERVGSKCSSSLPPPDMDLPAEREPLEPLEPLETSGQMVHEEF